MKPTIKDISRIRAINQSTLNNFYGWFINDKQNSFNRGAPLCAAICTMLDQIDAIREGIEFDPEEWSVPTAGRIRITTVPDLYSDPMEAVNGGLGFTGIPNSFMLSDPQCWIVVSHHDGKLMASQRLTDWISENGEPDNVSG